MTDNGGGYFNIRLLTYSRLLESEDPNAVEDGPKPEAPGEKVHGTCCLGRLLEGLLAKLEACIY